MNNIDTTPMPLLFLGHGSPMNAIEENEFVDGWRNIAESFPKPSAVVCISAHWETRGTLVTAMPKPRTIHDFGGFPAELYTVQYPASGNPNLAKELTKIITKNTVELDEKWGLDHGCWSVLKHLYPTADVPVIQLSLDSRQQPRFHYELAKELAPLRRDRVLIIGSGNLVHNLRAIAWDKINVPGFGFDWAIEANERIKNLIINNDYESLIHFELQGRALNLAIPTPEHYLPMLYVLALREENEEVSFFNDRMTGGSLSMTSFKIG